MVVDATATMKDETKVEAPAEEAIATFAKEVKVIIPPPDIKRIVDKTADFVRPRGAAFEKEIMDRNKSSKKFGFLQLENPYHAYYQQRLKYGDKPPEEEDMAGPTKKEEKVDVDVVEKKVVEKPKPKKKQPQNLKEEMLEVIKEMKSVNVSDVEAPPPTKYSVKTPDLFQASDIDIIKLTAQFVARNGRSFLQGLTAREQRNPQFDFCKPTHPLFSFFSNLVDAYTQIIIPPAELLADYKKKLSDPDGFLAECLVRAKWAKQEKEKEKKEESKQELERDAMQLIDWHQFVVVETIKFEKGEEEFLPKPKDNVYEIQQMLAAQDIGGGADTSSKRAANKKDNKKDDDDDDMDMDMDMDEDEDNEDDDLEDDNTVQKRRQIIQEDEPEPVMLTKGPSDDDLTFGLGDEATKFQKCPVCGEEIAIEDLQEHIRIELLDPKWKQQKELLAEKKKESSLAANASIIDNLSVLSRKRADVFIGRDEVGDESKVKQDEQKSLAVWDRVRKEQQDEAAVTARQKAAIPAPMIRPAIRPPSARPTLPNMHQPLMVRPPMPRPPMARPPMARPPMQAMQPTPTPTAPSQPRPPSSLPPASTTTQPPLPAGPRPPFSGLLPGMPNMMNMMNPNMMMNPARMQMISNPMAGLPAFPSMPVRPGMPTMPTMGNAGSLLGVTRPGAAPAASDEPSAKKSKGGLMPEAQWLAAHPEPISVNMVIPMDASKAEYNFSGQTLHITLEPTNTVAQFKNAVSAKLNGMPTSKMKISFVNGVFLNKDKGTLASYNVLNNQGFTLGVRERGGKKK